MNLSVVAYYNLYHTVDFLAQVGVIPGENGTEPDDPLTAATDTPEWQQISSDFPVGFAFYTQAVLDDYDGILASLNDGELRIGIESSGSLLTMLHVDLPGENPFRAAIPSTDEPGALQSLGISVRSKLLSVIVNCSVINSVWLANMPSSFDFTFVEALNPPTTVSCHVVKTSICTNTLMYVQVKYMLFSNNVSVALTSCTGLQVSDRTACFSVYHLPLSLPLSLSSLSPPQNEIDPRGPPVSCFV